MGLRGVCGAGAAGCLWIGDSKGSSEEILYDEIYIMIIEK